MTATKPIKPAKHGCGYVLGKNGTYKMFSRAGAERYAAIWAKKSSIRDAVALVADMGDYWRINIAGYPF